MQTGPRQSDDIPASKAIAALAERHREILERLQLGFIEPDTRRRSKYSDVNVRGTGPYQSGLQQAMAVPHIEVHAAIQISIGIAASWQPLSRVREGSSAATCRHRPSSDSSAERQPAMRFYNRLAVLPPLLLGHLRQAQPWSRDALPAKFIEGELFKDRRDVLLAQALSIPGEELAPSRAN